MCCVVYFYIITDQKNRFYKGITNNLKRRLHEHNYYKRGYTRFSSDWKYVHIERLLNRKDARIKEIISKNMKAKSYMIRYNKENIIKELSKRFED